MAQREPARENAPGRGNKTPADVEAIFAEEYLRTGIVSLASKKAGIPTRTGSEVAERLEESEEFTKRRRALLTRGLDRVETMLIKGCETASRRIGKKPKLIAQGKDRDALVDNGHNYLRAISDAHRSLVARRKLDHDVDPGNKPQWPAEIHITIDGQLQEPEPCKG